MVDAFTNNFSNFINELNNISNKGRYDVQPKLNPVKPKTINMSMPGLPMAGGGSSDLDRLIRAIKGQESSNDYGAYNKDSGASGAYQILKSNFVNSGGWDREALGRDISYSEFMNSPQIQDQIARYKLNQYLQKYGAAGAAVAWYGGPGAVSNMYSKTPQAGGYPSLYDYWNSVLSKM
jgi:hypothetical protein